MPCRGLVASSPHSRGDGLPVRAGRLTSSHVQDRHWTGRCPLPTSTATTEHRRAGSLPGDVRGPTQSRNEFKRRERGANPMHLVATPLGALHQFGPDAPLPPRYADHPYWRDTAMAATAICGTLWCRCYRRCGPDRTLTETRPTMPSTRQQVTKLAPPPRSRAASSATVGERSASPNSPALPPPAYRNSHRASKPSTRPSLSGEYVDSTRPRRSKWLRRNTSPSRFRP